MFVQTELCKGIFVWRKQIPVILAYAIPIHKAQGLTLDTIITSLDCYIFAEGMAYVALSRVHSLKELNLLAFDVDSVRCDPRQVEYNRLRKAFCPHLPPFQVPKRPRRKKAVLTRPTGDDPIVLDEETKPRKRKTCSRRNHS